MSKYKDILPLLKQLNELVDEYDPIKYKSTNESKLLSEKIPQVYGAVQEVYRNITGNLKVELSDRGTTSFYPNYFEAGYLSGITIHAHKGRQELLQVIGRVDAEIKNGKSHEATQPMTDEPNVEEKVKITNLSLPDKITIPWLIKHVPITLWALSLSTLFAAFVAGIQSSKLTLIQELFELTPENNAQIKVPDTSSKLGVPPDHSSNIEDEIDLEKIPYE